MEDAFDRFVETGKLQMRDMVDAMIRDLSRLAFRQMVAGPLTQGLTNALGGAFGVALPMGGGRSGGGRVFPSMAFPVGERGQREWFMPKMPGMIVPESRAHSRSAGERGRTGADAAQRPIAITFNVTTPDAEGFRRSEGQITAMLSRAVSRGGRNL